MRAALVATLITLGLCLQGGLLGYYLGPWCAPLALAIGYMEGRWWIGRLLLRWRVLTVQLKAPGS